MRVELYTPPAIEPITLSDQKLHLRLDSGSFSGNIDETQSLPPALYAIQDNYTTHIGTGVNVLGYSAVVILNSGTNGATGTVDVKIQESDDNITYTDWTGGAFTQVTTANDNAIQEKAYTGSKSYIRTVAKVLLATCYFSTTIIRQAATTIEDDLLTMDITTARLDVENDTRRALITQTWDYYLDEFPRENYIKIPFGNLQSVTHIKYTDSDGTQTTMAATTDYLVETNGDQCGRIVLPYGKSWPSFTEATTKPIVIRFVCGYGDLASDVPATARQAILRRAAVYYESRGEDVVGLSVVEDKVYNRLINNVPILYDEFE